MREETAIKAETLELSAPERLSERHDLRQFDCGETSINAYLTGKAVDAQQAKHAVVYVTCLKGTNIVAAYYTLSNGSVGRVHGASAKIRRNAPDHLPVVVLGRMGVTKEIAAQGVGTDLLKDAVEKAIAASETIGCMALIVHPLSDRLEQFYAKHGFRACPSLSPKTMMLPLR